MTGPMFLGAYALFGGVATDELAEAYRALEPEPLIGGLEMPIAEALGHRAELGALRRGLPSAVADHWDVVITYVPTVMGRLGAEPGYGLASTDGDGRRAAVEDVRRGLDLARAAAYASGRQRVRALEVQSAPRRASASPAAFEASLSELLEVDGAGAVLAVEHCDAPRPGRTPSKGFLEIEEELEVLDALDDPRLGLAINWGRSAIEGRSVRTPVEHVETAASAGRLAGLMFSGVSDAAGPWGASPWADGHIAPRGAGSDPAAWTESLLGLDEMRETWRATAGTAPGFVGVKVTAKPPETPVAERLVVARRSLQLVAQAAA